MNISPMTVRDLARGAGPSASRRSPQAAAARHDSATLSSGRPSLPMHLLRPGEGHGRARRLSLPPCMDWGQSCAQRHESLGVDLVVRVGLPIESERPGRGVPGLFASSNRAPATNPTGRATRSSHACPSCRACPQPSLPVWRPAPRRSPAGARESWSGPGCPA